MLARGHKYLVNLINCVTTNNKMRNLIIIILTLLSLRQDSPIFIEKPIYSDDNYRKILWVDILNQSSDDYHVYLYSLSCRYCQLLEAEINGFINKSPDPVYLIEVTPYLPFGAFNSQCNCHLSCLRLPAYPIIYSISQGCVIDVIIGRQNISSWITDIGIRG